MKKVLMCAFAMYIGIVAVADVPGPTFCLRATPWIGECIPGVPPDEYCEIRMPRLLDCRGMSEE